ncbi:MAG: putative porin [Vicinamibacteria bacterium]|nr:putative porin [Vicinamibacteria bacterium]
MKTTYCLVLSALLVTSSASGQTYQRQSEPYAFTVDTLARYEWNEEAPDEYVEARRWLLRLRPKIELGGPSLALGIGAEFNHGSDKNTELPDDAPRLLRDNYDSRAGRLDLAYIRIRPMTWIEIQGGRFPMPGELTEMVWDPDLRPQGAAISVSQSDGSGTWSRTGLTLLWARGSHALDHKHGDLLLASARLGMHPGPYTQRQRTELGLAGTFLQFSRLEDLDQRLYRQNSLQNGKLESRYRVIDVSGALKSSADVPLSLSVDYCWNIEAEEKNRGLWLSFTLGDLGLSLARFNYAYARVDRDAVLAAYATDDFLWGTGWDGHRGEVAARIGPRTSLHLIGQLQRFKDAPDLEERDRWSKRVRLEMRAWY